MEGLEALVAPQRMPLWARVSRKARLQLDRKLDRKGVGSRKTPQFTSTLCTRAGSLIVASCLLLERREIRSETPRPQKQ